MTDENTYLARHSECGTEYFRPWSKWSEQWQTQSLLDAVQDKGLEREFLDELSRIQGVKQDRERNPLKYNWWLASAQPEAICSAILSMEGE